MFRRAKLTVVLALLAGVPRAAADGDPRVRTNQPTKLEVAQADSSASRSVVNERPIPRRAPDRATSAATSSEGAASVKLPATNLVSMFWPLAVVIALVVGMAAAVKKWMPGAARVTGGGAIAVLARQYLSSKQSLCLIRLGRRVVLVGMTPESMVTLSEITDAEEIAVIASSLERGKSDAFATALAKTGDDDAEPEELPNQLDSIPTPMPTRRSPPLDNGDSRVSDLIDRIRAISVGRPTSARSTSAGSTSAGSTSRS